MVTVSEIFPDYIFFSEFVKYSTFNTFGWINRMFNSKFNVVIVSPDVDESFFHIITFVLECGGTVSRHIKFNDYAPGEANTPL